MQSLSFPIVLLISTGPNLFQMCTLTPLVFICLKQQFHGIYSGRPHFTKAFCQKVGNGSILKKIFHPKCAPLIRSQESKTLLPKDRLQAKFGNFPVFHLNVAFNTSRDVVGTRYISAHGFDILCINLGPVEKIDLQVLIQYPASIFNANCIPARTLSELVFKVFCQVLQNPVVFLVNTIVALLQRIKLPKQLPFALHCTIQKPPRVASFKRRW